MSSTYDPVYVAASLEWQAHSNSEFPDSAHAGDQKDWDIPCVNRKREVVISAAQSQAGACPSYCGCCSSFWWFLTCHTLFVSLVRDLTDTSLRIAISLHLGAIICAPHTCVCGQSVDSSGTHGLACRKSAGRLMRHNAVNDLIKRALASAHVPALLEPKSLCRDDGKRPRWSLCSAMGQRSLPRVGLHVHRYSCC